MRTVRTKVYQFEELSQEAQQTAIENFRTNKEIFLDFFNEDAEEQIKAAGFLGNIKLQYSLSNSQGDGLSFKCNDIDKDVLKSLFRKILGDKKEKTIDIILEYCTFESRGNTGRYAYASKQDILFEFDDYKANHYLIHSVVSKVEDKIKALYMDLCRKLEKQGYSEIENQLSDEYIKDEIINNNLEFLTNGKQF